MQADNRDNAKLKDRYIQIKKIVKDSIDEWDPIELLGFCPPDEYDLEITRVTALVTENIQVDALAKGILIVFIDCFGQDVFQKDLNECLLVATGIKRRIKESKLFD